jgi:hypothetical protein
MANQPHGVTDVTVHDLSCPERFIQWRLESGDRHCPLGGDDGGPRSEAVGGAKRSGPPVRCVDGRASSTRAASGADWCCNRHTTLRARREYVAVSGTASR